MPWVNYNLYDLKRALIIPEKSIPEKRVLYVRGKHCGLPGFGFPGSMQTSQKEEIGFTHVGLSNYCARG